MKKLLSLLLALCLTLSLALPGLAVTFTDAHGNVIELDDTLEAYTETALFGAEHAARKGETNLGDLWTDALRWFAVSGKINDYFEEDDVTAGNSSVAVDAAHVVALWNGGNLREDLAVGKFGAEELAKVLPYPNKVALVYMSGAQLREALEVASQALPYSEDTASACASLMQVAGLKYSVDLEQPYDKGEACGKSWFKANSVRRVRVTEVNGAPLDEEALYAVVTSNANYNGMDSSYLFKEAAEANEKSTITTAVVRDVVWMYLDEVLNHAVKEDAYGQTQGRITLLKKPVVQRTAQKLTIDGEERSAEVYNIDNRNYFKLRDMAALLADTDAAFSVAYDKARDTVIVRTGEAYEKQPGDLEQGADRSAKAVRSRQALEIDGVSVTDLLVFNLDGNNFFQLRELGAALGFGVDYDPASDTMVVTTK